MQTFLYLTAAIQINKKGILYLLQIHDVLLYIVLVFDCPRVYWLSRERIAYVLLKESKLLYQI